MKNLRYVASATLGMALLVGSAVPVFARDRDNNRCRSKIEKAENNLRNAERKHGDHSRQVMKRRRQLEDARRSCHMDRDHDHDGDRH